MTRARTIGSGWLAAVAALALAACGSRGSSSGSGASTSSRSSTTTSTTTAPTGRPTQWRDDTAHWKQLAPGAFSESPTKVADDLAARYRGGDTSSVGQVSVAEVRTGEPLVIALHESGVSEGIRGREIEITLEGGDQGWAVSSARVRDLCVEVAESTPTQCV